MSSNDIDIQYGLLSITIGNGDNAHELYKESLPFISQALKSQTKSLLLSVIDCLAIATFVGVNDFEETEASMQILWQFILPESGENVVVKKHSASVLSAAISAWSLLLTTVDGWHLNYNHWRGAISYFLDLLEVDDQSVCMAAGEAIALICEIGFLEKFASNITIDKISLKEKEQNITDQDYSIQKLQEIVSNNVKRLSSQKTAAAKALNGWNNFSPNVLGVFKDGCFHETALKIGKHSLQLRSLSQLLQENEFLHDVFNFWPSKQKSGDEPYIAEREEVIIHIFVPKARPKDSEEDFGRTQKQNKSTFRKVKTQLLNKHRAIRGEELWPYDD
ncbi:hypothetical protein DH2020_023962 [Rehmannia glutinosa]|uniref:Interferon-related developmental regulator N-terminal domain-containing protein n=1 Tax=Rehmannia glutinosa TaxID=99300 RepID=A0ABR0WBZ3_REHGL